MPAIEVRPVSLQDLAMLINIDHNSMTTHVWQMDRSMGDAQLLVNFREIRLPRPVRIEYPHVPDFGKEDWISHGVVLAALIKDVAVGYIRLEEHSYAKTMWITDLAVREDLRRKGIASGMVISAQELAVQRGMRRLILEMQSKNYPAIKMAQKLGYEFCGYNDQFYTTQDIAIFFARIIR
jgi:ribosomal protein S18 acetylase RimI-like enzyme